MRHGPHHGAQKSTSTGTSDFSTSRSNVASVTTVASEPVGIRGGTRTEVEGASVSRCVRRVGRDTAIATYDSSYSYIARRRLVSRRRRRDARSTPHRHRGRHVGPAIASPSRRASFPTRTTGPRRRLRARARADAMRLFPIHRCASSIDRLASRPRRRRGRRRRRTRDPSIARVTRAFARASPTLCTYRSCSSPPRERRRVHRALCVGAYASPRRGPSSSSSASTRSSSSCRSSSSSSSSSAARAPTRSIEVEDEDGSTDRGVCVGTQSWVVIGGVDGMGLEGRDSWACVPSWACGFGTRPTDRSVGRSVSVTHRPPARDGRRCRWGRRR